MVSPKHSKDWLRITTIMSYLTSEFHPVLNPFIRRRSQGNVVNDKVLSTNVPMSTPFWEMDYPNILHTYSMSPCRTVTNVYACVVFSPGVWESLQGPNIENKNNGQISGERLKYDKTTPFVTGLTGAHRTRVVYFFRTWVRISKKGRGLPTLHKLITIIAFAIRQCAACAWTLITSRKKLLEGNQGKSKAVEFSLTCRTACTVGALTVARPFLRLFTPGAQQWLGFEKYWRQPL